MTLKENADRLLALHEDQALLTVVNVWDPISAQVVASEPGTTALATASHSIAASFGYEDGERIPLSLHLEAIQRIVQATDLPVSADLEAGYGDVGETIRRAIGVGVVGANIEDQLKPLDEAVRGVEAALAAGEAEGIRFVLNARTDAFVRGGDRTPEENLQDAVTRGQAYIAAGAPVVFVPGRLDEAAGAARSWTPSGRRSCRSSECPAPCRWRSSRISASHASRTGPSPSASP